MDFAKSIDQLISIGRLPKELGETIKFFCISYSAALNNSGQMSPKNLSVLDTFISLVVEALEHPYTFEAFHQRITEPVDYYQFGLDLMRPLIDFKHSSLMHPERVSKIIGQMQNGDNVILFGNHQTEPDPQAINLMLEKEFLDFAKNIIFVAGHRVTSDPLAIPFSKGCNLLCIFSKKYIESPPEQKEQKQLHNQRTMKKMQSLLEKGGKCIYVAPSGGRDRVNSEGVVEVAPFDPQSIEMFRLIAQQAHRPTHFYPLTLYTYHLLPPPSSITVNVGEPRFAQCSPVHVCFGEEVDMENFPGSTPQDKRKNRELRSEYIFNLIKNDYQQILERLA